MVTTPSLIPILSIAKIVWNNQSAVQAVAQYFQQITTIQHVSYNEFMFVLSKSLVGQKVMSLRTGGQVGTTLAPIINPNNLKVEGFYCQDSKDKKNKLVLLYQDIRDVVPQGIVVNDHEALTDPAELVRLKDILALNFELIGKPVYAQNKQKLGKVNDYATELSTFFIEKLYVGQPLVKSLSGGSLSVERDQIVEITNRKIVIKDPLQGIKDTEAQPAPAIPAT
jgi:uncharacterized protein YrrD